MFWLTDNSRSQVQTFLSYVAMGIAKSGIEKYELFLTLKIHYLHFFILAFDNKNCFGQLIVEIEAQI